MSDPSLDSGEMVPPHERRRSSDVLVEALRGELRAFRRELLAHAANEERELGEIKSLVTEHTRILLGDGRQRGLVEQVRSEADASNETACRVARLERAVAGTDETPGLPARVSTIERTLAERSQAEQETVRTLREIAASMVALRSEVSQHGSWIDQRAGLERRAIQATLALIATALLWVVLRHASDLLALLKG